MFPRHLAPRLFLLVLVMSLPRFASAQDFVHPGGLHTKADLDRMKSRVAAGEHPWIDGWKELIGDRKAQNTYRAAPKANMGVSRQRAQDDATAAYLNALRWSISGDKSYAECAVRNLNGWSATVDQLPSGPDQPGLGGIPIGSFALAAEVLRTYPGWPAADQERFQKMLRNYFYPVCDRFLTTHNHSDPTRYWANWDAANILSLLAIGVFCDDRAIFDQGVAYFKNGPGMGSIKNAVPFLYPGGLGQWQEAGRDFAHTMGGQGLLAEACQVAWNQSVDLFGYDHNRLLAGAEYAAQYTLWKGVPYTFYTNADQASQYYISQNYHGRLQASHFELLYNHYVVRKGLPAPNVQSFAELRRPEPGEIDVFGYGTLTYTLDAKASPFPAFSAAPIPRDLTATPGLGRVKLKWSPSGAYTAHGYEVFRATRSEGPYTSISSTTIWTTPEFTDTAVANGTTYYYVVSALNQSGASAHSEPASARPVAGAALPAGWISMDLGKTGAASGDQYARAANQTFIIRATGADIGGTADSGRYVSTSVSGDFTITARLIGRLGTVNKMGLMMREDSSVDARMVTMTLGEIGGRQARSGTRVKAGGATATQRGNDYTWLPVWFRLQRTGDVFTASQSSDGARWFTVGTSTVPMPKTYLAGLMAVAGSKATGAPATAAFDHVAIDPKPPHSPDAPGNLSAARAGGRMVKLTWVNESTNNQTGFKIEASSGKAPFYEIADLGADATSFLNTGLKTPASFRYRVRAYNTGGYSAYSNIAEIAKP